MKKSTLIILLAIIATLQACGQKGPLEVERTQVIQEEDSEDIR